MLCPACKTDWPEDRFNGTHPQCFRCRAQSISVAFAGGRDYFHGPTDRERTAKQVAEAAANGYEAVPAWTKTDYSGGTAQMSKLASKIGVE